MQQQSKQLTTQLLIKTAYFTSHKCFVPEIYTWQAAKNVHFKYMVYS